MFTEHTTIEQMQTEIWELYKDVHGMRPRYFTQQEWDSREFLQKQFDNLIKIVDNMTPAEKIENGWA
jgi:hypothetical protein